MRFYRAGEGGGCFSTISQTKDHLDPFDPSELSLLKRKEKREGKRK